MRISDWSSDVCSSDLINEVWTKVNQIGTYRGVCAELGGRDNGVMPIVVYVVSEDDYKAFIASKKAGGDAASADSAQAAPAATTEVAAAGPSTSTDATPAAVEVAAADAKADAPAAAKEMSKDDLVKKGQAVDRKSTRLNSSH